MISELLPGLTLSVLFGLISGRSTGTRLLAVSKLSWKICVTICPLAGGTGPADTVAPCSLASASGTTRYRPPDSTMAKPCVRSCAANWRSAWVGVTGAAVTSVSVPLTRGSTTTLRPVRVAMVRATASISALAKFSVTASPRRGAAGSAFCGCAGRAASRPTASSATASGRRSGRGRRGNRVFMRFIPRK